MVVTIDSLAGGCLVRENKIGEGKYREVYKVGDSVLKVLKPFVHKGRGLFYSEIPTSLYTNLVMGIKDFNRFEYDSYQSFIGDIPDGFRSNFASIYDVGSYDGRSASLSELVTDFDGGISKSLFRFGKVSDLGFWNTVDLLEEVLLDEKIFLMDIRPENVLVQKSEDGKLSPVLFDYKRFGSKTYPFKFWLRSEKACSDKISGRFEGLRENYMLD